MNVLLFKMLARQVEAGNIRIEDIKDETYRDAVTGVLDVED